MNGLNFKGQDALKQGNARENIRHVVLSGLFVALTIIGARININLPGYPVPITLQCAFVLLAGCVLHKKVAALSQITYLFLGLAGLPVFAGAGAGPAYVLKHSFGYILGFIPAAYCTALIIERMGAGRYKSYLTGTIAGMLTTYAVGIFYFFLLTNLYLDNSMGFVDVLVKTSFFVTFPKDLIISALTASLAMQVHRSIGRAVSM